MLAGNLILTLLLVFQGASDWKRQTLATGLSVEAPVTIAPFVVNGDGKTGPKGMYSWMGSSKSKTLFGLVRIASKATDRRSDLIAFTRGMAEGGDGRIVKRKEIAVGKNKGFEIEYSSMIGCSVARSFAIGNKLYFAYVTSRGAQRPPEADRFLKSLKLPSK